MNVKYCDALVIGGGLAGLRAAIATQSKGLSTTVLSLCPVKRSHSAAAQGGMQASLGNSKMSRGDNEDVHFADTVKGKGVSFMEDVRAWHGKVPNDEQLEIALNEIKEGF